MGNKTLDLPQPGVERGIQYTQKAFSDAATHDDGYELVPAITGHTGVVDKLVIVSTADETISLVSDTYNSGDFLLPVVEILAKTMTTVEGIRGEVDKRIWLVGTVGQMAGVVHYHYEISG